MLPTTRRYSLVASAVTLALSSSSVQAGLDGMTRVATGFSAPMFATYAPGRSDVMFVAERGSPVNSSNSTANIRIFNPATGAINPTPFLSIPGIDNTGEGGLLGMAFHPDYETNGKFYVYLTAPDSVAGTPFSSYVREYTRSTTNPDVALPTARPILTFTQPQTNHNGGWIGFGPNDGYLYIMTGDGGGGNDSDAGHTAGTGNAQDITNNWLGKALRIDVDGDDFADANRNYAIPPTNPFISGPNADGDDEIWAYGLRNPFRASFDRKTGDLWIGDVGQGSREEIDFQPASSPGGENYGWRKREGFIANPNSVGGELPGATDPIYDYRRPGSAGVDPNFTGTTVTGGQVYRGPDPELQGMYFFADYTANRIWMLNPPEGTEAVDVDFVSPLLTPNAGTASNIVAFGEDYFGNLYAVSISGSIFRIDTDAGDFDGSNVVDGDDLAALTANFGIGSAFNQGDADRDGDVDGADFLVFQRNVGATPHATAAAANVPEPASAALLLLAAAALAWRRNDLAGGAAAS